MLSLAIKDVGDEIRAARAFRDKHTKQTRELVRRFCGKWYREDMTCEPTPENHVFAYVAFMLAELSYSSPSADVKPAWTQALGEVSKAMEIAIERWGTTFPLATEQQLIARDTLFGWGVMKVGLESAASRRPAPNMTAGPLGVQMAEQDSGISSGGEWWTEEESVEPFAVHVPMWDFFLDGRCENWRHARFHAHEYWKDLDELKEMRGANTELVDRMSGESQTHPRESQNRALIEGETGDRKQIRCIDIWFPEHSKVATVIECSNGFQYLRDPTDWWGPRGGPFEVFGFYSISGDPYPLGPLTPVFDQLLELQSHVSEAAREAGRHKRVTLIDSTAADIATAVQKGENDGVYIVKQLGNNIQVVESGGASQQRMEHVSQLRERVDRILGTSDAQRGVASSRVTATVGQIVQNNVDMRTSWMRMCITVGMSLVLKKVGWYMFYDPLFTSRVSIAGQDGTFRGGIWPGQENMDWEKDFAVTVKANSMSMSDDQALQSRAMQLLALAPQVAQGIATMPTVNWRALVDMLGESYNERDLYNRVFGQVQSNPNPNAIGINPELAEQIQNTAQAMGMNVMGPNVGAALAATPMTPEQGQMTQAGTRTPPPQEIAAMSQGAMQ